MRCFILLITLSVIISIPLNTYAHPGRLDKNGGHNVNTADWGYPVGSYHFHYGSDRNTAYDKDGKVINLEDDNSPIELDANSARANISSLAEAEEITVKVDGETIQFIQSPELINGRVMVPIRSVVEKIGYFVEWDAQSQTVYVKSSEIVSNRSLSKTDTINVCVNNELIDFGLAQPININGHTLISVAFVMEKLGYTVEWDGDLKTVYINKP